MMVENSKSYGGGWFAIGLFDPRQRICAVGALACAFQIKWLTGLMLTTLMVYNAYVSAVWLPYIFCSCLVHQSRKVPQKMLDMWDACTQTYCRPTYVPDLLTPCLFSTFLFDWREIFASWCWKTWTLFFLIHPLVKLLCSKWTKQWHKSLQTISLFTIHQLTSTYLNVGCRASTFSWHLFSTNSISN